MPPGPKSPIKIKLTDEDKIKFEKLFKDRELDDKTRKRIAVILLLAEGCSISLIKQILNIDRKTIRRWAYLFLEDGIIAFFQDIPRSGRSRKFSNEDPGKYVIKRKKWSCKYSKEEVEKQKFAIGVLNKIIKKMLRMN